MSRGKANVTGGAKRLPSAKWRAALRRRLLAWYSGNARELPWRRRRPDPYHVWLSEIMLQQTQVATVRPYFEQFITALPRIERLAAAKQEQVLRLWEGLGYYRRARQLHDAAKIIVHQHGGEFPRDPECVRKLPGIGRYTAGAILSIAFGLREPIVEANSRRLYARLLALRDDPASAAAEQLLWRFAESLLPDRDPGEFNQALMELGSLICTPRAPQCDVCPLRDLCPTAKAGLQASIPPPKRKPKVTAVHAAAVAIRRRGRILVVRQNGGRFDGLWDFPRVELASNSSAARRKLPDMITEICGIRPVNLTHLTTIRHTITRFRITLDCYLASAGKALPSLTGRARGRVTTESNGQLQRQKKISNDTAALVRWISSTELDSLPLSATGRRLAHMIQDKNQPSVT